MAMSYTRLTLIGHVGADPEVRTLPSGDPAVCFRVAVGERVRGEDQTTWYVATAYGRLGETCGAHLHKGSAVYLEGALSLRTYTDRDGKERVSPDLTVREMRLLDRRTEAGTAGSGASEELAADEVAADDVPF